MRALVIRLHECSDFTFTPTSRVGIVGQGQELVPQTPAAFMRCNNDGHLRVPTFLYNARVSNWLVFLIDADEEPRVWGFEHPREPRLVFGQRDFIGGA